MSLSTAESPAPAAMSHRQVLQAMSGLMRLADEAA